MLSLLPHIASEIPVPPVVWRADTGFMHEDRTSAADVVSHERAANGRLLDLSAGFVAFLADFHAASLLWVTFTPQEAARYGEPLAVRIEEAACVIGTDEEGGYLLFFYDDPAMSQGSSAPARSAPTKSRMAARSSPEKRKIVETGTPSSSGSGGRVAVAAAALAIALHSHQKAKHMNNPTALSDRPDLDEKRREDLATRIDALQQDAERITTKDGASAQPEYRAHREAFDDRQGKLAEQVAAAPQEERQGIQAEKEAQGHEYAGFLATGIAGHMKDEGRHADAAGMMQEAEARTSIAVQLREGTNPDRPNDPARQNREEPGPATGRVIDHPPGSRYDALRATEQAAGNTQTMERSAEAPGSDEPGPTRPLGHNIRPEVVPVPGGTETRTTVQSSVPPEKGGDGPKQESAMSATNEPAGAKAPQRDGAEAEKPGQHHDPAAAAYVQSVNDYLRQHQEKSGATPEQMQAAVDALHRPADAAEKPDSGIKDAAAESTKRQGAEPGEAKGQAQEAEAPEGGAKPMSAREQQAARFADYRALRDEHSKAGREDGGNEPQPPQVYRGRD